MNEMNEGLVLPVHLIVRVKVRKIKRIGIRIGIEAVVPVVVLKRR